MKPYSAYKDSGVDWLGKIPIYWECLRLKNCTTLITEKKSTSCQQLGLENIDSWTGLFINTATVFETEGIGFSQGDLLFGKLRPYLAKLWIATFEGCAVGDFFVLHCRNFIINNFLKYYILNEKAISEINSSTFGAKMPRVSWNWLGNFIISFPPLPEQQAIVDYLDQETAEMDALINEQEELISLLKQKRSAIISEAVCRGLDPAVPIKDSGVEWLGMIPKEWKVSTIKKGTRQIKTGGTPAGVLESDFCEDGLPWYTPGDFSNTAKLTTSGRSLTSSGINKVSIFPPNSVYLVSIGATIGKVAIADHYSACNQQISVLIPELKLLYKFLFFYLLSNKDIVINLSNSTTLPIVNQKQIGTIPLLLPPLPEQQTIVDYLDRETAEIDHLIADCETSIQLLKQRRTSLISEAVTGKIDVRTA